MPLLRDICRILSASLADARGEQLADGSPEPVNLSIQLTPGRRPGEWKVTVEAIIRT